MKFGTGKRKQKSKLEYVEYALINKKVDTEVNPDFTEV